MPSKAWALIVFTNFSNGTKLFTFGITFSDATCDTSGF